MEETLAVCWTRGILVNASVKGTTAEICTGICPDYDHVTWRSRGCTHVKFEADATLEEVDSGGRNSVRKNGSSAPGRTAADCLLGRSSGRRAWDLSGQEAEQKPAVCSGSREGQVNCVN